MYKVKFSRYFVNGNLKGIMVDSSLSFPTLELACDYVKFCHMHCKIPVKAFGGSDYTLHMSRIERSNEVTL